jgi:hypothetical protein
VKTVEDDTKDSQQLVRRASTPSRTPLSIKSAGSPNDYQFVYDTFSTQFRPFSSPPPLNLNPPAKDVAIARFFTDYILPGSETVPEEGYLEYLPKLHDEAFEGSCLRLTVSAVSLAHLGNIQRLPSLRSDAARDYAKALQLTKVALLSDAESRTTQTLLAVYLLSMYEVGQR